MHFCFNKFKEFVSPGKVNDKMQGFPGFPGRVGTLYTTFIVGQGSQFERIQGTIKYPTFDKNLGITRESIIL